MNDRNIHVQQCFGNGNYKRRASVLAVIIWVMDKVLCSVWGFTDRRITVMWSEIHGTWYPPASLSISDFFITTLKVLSLHARHSSQNDFNSAHIWTTGVKEQRLRYSRKVCSWECLGTRGNEWNEIVPNYVMRNFIELDSSPHITRMARSRKVIWAV
jgi:hypothetical protein